MRALMLITLVFGIANCAPSASNRSTDLSTAHKMTLTMASGH